MCGIAGIIRRGSSTYDQQHLQKMMDALAHRGPDGESSWINADKTVLFGHRRLSIIDLSSAGCQPMRYAGRYTIIHNGEIYNYLELREQLKALGHHFLSGTDTEVIAASFDEWGEDCVSYFDGMFSFAIWDEKEKELFAARDRFGEKPFFYFFDEESFLFGSEMKALWAAGIQRVPNRKMLFNFLTIGYTGNPTDPGETFFEQIEKLPPATTLLFSVSLNKITLEKYWDLDPSVENKKISISDAVEQFSTLFKTSVQRRLRTDVPLGCNLSGGIDSSAVAAIASRQLNSSFNVFTAIFPGFEKDESELSKTVADTLGLVRHTLVPSSLDMLNELEKIAYHQEEPFGSASIYPQFKLFGLAKKYGVKVLLDGQGADETLAGYHKYYKWHWQELFRRRRLLRSKEISAAKKLGVDESFGLKNMVASFFPEFATVMLEKQYLLKAIRQEDLSPEFVRLQSKEAYYSTPDHFTLNGVLYFNTCVNGLEELLRYADRNAMAHGREVRLPFLSHELVEFIFSLPASFKIREGWTKWILREAMKKQLPPEITWRKDKVGFEPPQKAWMHDPAVVDAIRDAKKILVEEKILKPGVEDKKIVTRSAHEADNYDWRYFSAANLFRSL